MTCHRSLAAHKRHKRSKHCVLFRARQIVVARVSVLGASVGFRVAEHLSDTVKTLIALARGLSQVSGLLRARPSELAAKGRNARKVNDKGG